MWTGIRLLVEGMPIDIVMKGLLINDVEKFTKLKLKRFHHQQLYLIPPQIIQFTKHNHFRKVLGEARFYKDGNYVF